MKVGDKVRFKNSVVARIGHDKRTADMRGTVLSIRGDAVEVDTHGTFTSEDGRAVRLIPLGNLEISK